MKIITDDKNGVGKIKGDFVYVYIDEYGDLDCGIKMGCVMNGSSIISAPLIDTNEGKVEFDFYSRDILDASSSNKIAILSKYEILKMISSLTRVYEAME